MATANSGPITGIDLAGCMVSDPKRSIAFYRDVLGITPTEIDDQGRGAEFTLADGSTFGVWHQDGAKDSGSGIMFAVDDIDAALATLRERGAELSDKFESPVCFMSFGEDPDGNGYMIHQRKR
jgi:predicted enzyme related to lactoylglutathione lyase